MNEMRKLMEAVQQLDEAPTSPLEFFANEVSEYCGENIGPKDLEVYTDGMSYAILCKATDEQFLYSDNIYGEGELEPAEFDRWPPKVHAHYGTVLRKVSEGTETELHSDPEWVNSDELAVFAGLYSSDPDAREKRTQFWNIDTPEGDKRGSLKAMNTFLASVGADLRVYDVSFDDPHEEWLYWKVKKPNESMTEARLDEYLLQTGMTLGEVFDAVLGNLDAEKRGTDEFEPNYLEGLGFMDAASDMEDMVDDVMELKQELQPLWNDEVVNDEVLDELLGVAYHLEASSEYDDEEAYLETIVRSYENTIEFLLNNYDLLVDRDDY